MSEVAAIVAKLIAAGANPAAAAEAVAAAFAAGAVSVSTGKSGGIPVDTAAEKRRAYDRARKAEKRNSTGIPVESPRNSENALYLTSSPTPSESSERKKERKGRGEKLSAEFRPSEGHYATGAELGHDRAAVDAIAEEMRDWARANEHRAVARKSDWDATLMGWIRRAKRATGPPGFGRALTPSELQKQKSDDAIAKLREFSDRLAAGDQHGEQVGGLLLEGPGERSAGVSGGRGGRADELPGLGFAARR